ncbi:MAG: ABC transporter permease [Anaerolineales bacterium]|nr:ABC transporter permease [Anaerolineales bacterium]
MQTQTAAISRIRARLAHSSETVTLISFLTVFIFFTVSAENFTTPVSLSNILSFASILGIITAGVAMLMIAGEFDLSVGANFAVASFVLALTLNAGISPLLALLLALLSSALLGLLNGLIVVGTGIPSFITTLGTMLAYRGIARAIGGGGLAKYTETRPVLFDVLNGSIDSFNKLFLPVANFRVSIIWFFLIAGVMSIVLMRFRFGNWIFATGGNPDAALAQGVPVKRVKLIAFSITGLLTGVASVMQFAQRTSVDPLRGEGWELICVAACVIGGVQLTGGVGTIIGAGLGIILLQMLEQGLVLMGVSVQIFRAVAGAILLLSVVLNTYLGRQES